MTLAKYGVTQAVDGQMIEYTCEDCKGEIVNVSVDVAPDPPLCAVCAWIREFVPAEERAEMRRRLHHYDD